MGLNPRKMAAIDDFDRGIQACILCGECVDACNTVNKGKGNIAFVRDIKNFS